MGIMERRLVHIAWAVRQLKRYTSFAKKVRVLLPDSESLLVVSNRDHH